MTLFKPPKLLLTITTDAITQLLDVSIIIGHVTNISLQFRPLQGVPIRL